MTVIELLRPYQTIIVNIFISERNTKKLVYLGTNKTIYAHPRILRREVFKYRIQGDIFSSRMAIEFVVNQRIKEEN